MFAAASFIIGLKFMAVISGAATMCKLSAARVATFERLLDWSVCRKDWRVCLRYYKEMLSVTGWTCGAPQCEAAVYLLCANMKWKAK